MNRRDFTTRTAAAALALGGAFNAHAQTEADDGDYDPVDMDAVTRIEFSALAATGVTVMTPNGLSVQRLVSPPTPRGGARPGGRARTRSSVQPGRLPAVPKVTNSYWSSDIATRTAPVWPADDRAPDYRHLSDRTVNGIALKGFERSSDPGFVLNGETLRFLAKANAFNLDALKRPMVVFGLRGCTAEAPSVETPKWALRHNMRVARPDHINFRCIIGVWKTDTDEIAVWRASTVPEVSLMHAYTSPLAKGFGCSLMPTGFYRYRAGTHGGSFPQPGSLRVDQTYVVLRTPGDLSYDPFQTEDVWTQGGGHNLHAAGVPPPAQFSSQGCQVIPGGYVKPLRVLAKNGWKGFRDGCGLTLADGLAGPEERDGKGTYQYMLLTGLEAALRYHNKPGFEAGYRRLRPGSSGPLVKSLQEQLFRAHNILGLADGEFGMGTSFAVLYEKKRTEGEHTSPIWEY